MKIKVRETKKCEAVSPYSSMDGKTADERLKDKDVAYIEIADGDNDTICPFCGEEDDYKSAGMDHHGNYVYSYTCSKCGRNWDSVYAVEPYEIVIRK